jgi:hypothetical protein
MNVPEMNAPQMNDLEMSKVAAELDTVTLQPMENEESGKCRQ